jgi:hypothetical protein
MYYYGAIRSIVLKNIPMYNVSKMITRRMSIFQITLFFLLINGVLWASERQDRHGGLAGELNRIYGIDDNAGLTTFPVLNIPMGGRSAGMASAFAAVADDASFIEHNPAGSSMLEKTEFAFFHNNWIADVNIEGIVYATRFNDFGIAAGGKWLYTPFTEYDLIAERVSSGYYSEGVAILNASYNFLSGFYFSGISVGVNLKGAFRRMPDFADKETSTIIPGSGREQSAVMGMIDIGALTRFDFLKTYTAREKNAAAALVVRNLGPPAKDEPLPTVINAAFSYKPIRPLLFSFDCFFPLNLMEPSLSELPYFAFGTSVSVTNFLSMRAGTMIKAGSSLISIGSAITLNKIAFDINYTLDLLTQMQPLNRVSMGVRLDLGDRGRKQKMDKANELYLLGVEAYSRNNNAEARYYWEETLSVDPKFEPARESLNLLKSREYLEERIEDMLRLEF